MPNINSLEYKRTLLKQERAVEYSELWEAVLAVSEALKALGVEFPDVHIRRAQEALLRAGKLTPGDLPDAVIAEIATVGAARIWEPDMGRVFEGEPIITASGDTYICTTTHKAQPLYEPGTEGGRTLFRLIRSEPETGYLDFAWGEHVPYGSVRRDPTDNKLYTPIHPEGITLYEPHYPSLVPSQYKEYTESGSETGGEDSGGSTGGDSGGSETTAYPKWSELEDGHVFNVGDYFTDYAKTYHVLRQFTKQANWRPPALTGDFYEEVTA